MSTTLDIENIVCLLKFRYIAMLDCLKNTQYQASTYFQKINNGQLLIRYVFINGRKQNTCFFIESDHGIYLIKARDIGLKKINSLPHLTYHLEKCISKGTLTLPKLILDAHWHKPKSPNVYHAQKPLRVAVIEEGVFLVTENSDYYQRTERSNSQ